MFRLIVHPGAEPWQPPPDVLQRLAAAFPYVNGTVHLWPRSDIQKVTGRSDAPYSYRGFTRAVPGPDVTHIFVDRTETPHSIGWLIGHELGHHKVRMRPALHQHFEQRQPHHLDPRSDVFHRVDPEEKYCDELATHALGYRTDRDWWRARTLRTGRVSRRQSFGSLHREGPWHLGRTL